ncbi:hypothetical protein KC359_g107 [Hortaea werneckii]|nr:hypothetical protein KC359_g107 [Hortaea werneckii]
MQQLHDNYMLAWRNFSRQAVQSAARKPIAASRLFGFMRPLAPRIAFIESMACDDFASHTLQGDHANNLTFYAEKAFGRSQA